MKLGLFFLFASFGLLASPFVDPNSNPKIGMQNAILAKVNGKTISMMDVKKKMDLVFHENYPQFVDSSQLRFQFYEMSWRQVLRNMIDHELMISDALDKEIKLTDADVRESMEERFGPNVMQTLDRIGLTYDETWKIVKNELIVQRMNWWFIQSKAEKSVTPQDIRQAYRLYLKENPPYSDWKYHVISIRADEKNDQIAEQIYNTIASEKKSPLDVKDLLKSLEKPGTSISISTEFTTKSPDLSDAHKTALATLAPGSYSNPIFQISKSDQKTVYRIFYLVDKVDFPAPSFEKISPQLKNHLVQQAILKESEGYLSKLRKFYGFDEHAIPDDLQPFSLQ